MHICKGCSWWPPAYLLHDVAGLCVQQLALGPGVEQEGVRAEGKGAVSAIVVLRLVMRLAPSHVVVLHVQLFTAQAMLHQLTSSGLGCKYGVCSKDIEASWASCAALHQSIV